MAQDSIPYKISYRKIKHPRLEFTTGILLLVLPLGHEHKRLLDKYKGWIQKKTDFINKCLTNAKNKKLVKRTDEEFRELVWFYAGKAAEELGVSIRRLSFRKMKTKWASCSSNVITINTFLKFLPDKLIEYAIYHEMAHIRGNCKSHKKR